MYTVLGPNLLPIGSLNINGNSKGTKFWGDTISQQIADDGSSDDPSTSLSMTANKIDTQANHKLWNHTITINFDNDDLGGQIISGYYLVYYDDVSLRYYLMNLTNVKESPQGGYRTATGSNAAIYDMAGIKPAKKSFTQASLTQILTYIFDDVTWSLKVEPNGVLIDYDIDGAKTVQSILQELQIKFSTEVDAYITLNNSGMIDERIVEVKKMGSNKGTLIRDGSSNNGYESIVRTSVSDTLYTKFYISGVTDETNPDYGSITSVNNGLNYIVDDDANRKYNPVGASQGSYREVSLENTVLKEPTALLDWGKEQVQLFNHPRYNYTVTSLHDMQASLGDTVAIQDLKAIPEILITSRVIQRTFSFSSPETNTLVFGEFSNLNIVSDVTSETITVLKKQVTVANQIANNAINTADDAKQTAIKAQESADGKGAVLTLKSKDDLPASAVNGTQAWVETASGTYHYVFIDGDWKEDISPTMQKDITDKVTASLTEAKGYSDKLVADNNTQINNTINEVSQEKIDLSLKNADFNEKAQAMADKALQDAKENTSTVAQETLNSANQNIADAKKSLSDSINKEVTDRANAVTALDTKAKGYADTAKSDAISASTTALNTAKTDLTNSIASEASARNAAVAAANSQAQTYANQAKADAMSAAASSADGVIRTAISSSANSLSATITQNKSSADSGISTAQTTAQAAVDGLKFKVSQTDYNTKTGQLQTDLTSTTQTANKATTDIASIKQKDSDQDSRMTRIESDASGVKTTVSDLQTAQGKQSGDISTLQQRADGFDATVTKVNNLSTGDRNYILDTGNPKTQTSNGTDNQDFRDKAIFYSPIKNWGIANGDYIISFDWTLKTALSSDMQASLFFNQSPYQRQFFTIPAGKLTGHVDLKFKLWGSILTASSDITGMTFIIMSQMASGNTITYANLFMKSGTIITTWTPAPEDLSSATAKAQLTADNAALNLSKYQTDADGRITKAQSDITQTAKDVTTKVSQTDYNAKTGDLTTKVNTAQSTADSANSTISAYKTSNDGRVTRAESKITQNTKDITTKVSQTVYDAKTNQLQTDLNTTTTTANKATTDIVSINQKDSSQDVRMTTIENDANGTKTSVSNLQTDLGKANGSISTLQQRADGFDATVTKVNNLSIGGRNLLLDTSTRTAVGPNAANNTPSAFRWTLSNSATVGSLYTAWGNNTPISLSFDWSITGSTISGTLSPQWGGAPWSIGAPGTPGVTVSSTNTSGHYTWSSTTQTGWSSSTAHNFTLRTDNLQGTLTITNLKFEQGNLPTTWTPAPEDVDNKISTVSQTVDSISSIVSDPTTGLTKRVQTAEGTLSQVTGADIPALQKATYWQPYGSLDFNSYTKQGSFFFNTTSAKTNGPVSGNNSWTYLMVEQGVSDNSRIKQTAWYDGVNGVKITYVRTLNSGTWSPWYANDNDSVTTISQTNSNIKQEIADRKTGDTNTLQSSKDFTQSSITSAVNGVNSTITQTSDSLIGKINTKTDQQTVLSLLKSNWSIGINDNIGGIVSGIVGNASQMSLISKKVVIDSPNTQITGKAWINSAMIGNGQIGTAQIGNAAIGNAQISAIDAAKITSGLINTQRLNVGEVFAQGINTTNATIGKTLTIGSGGAITWSLNGSVQNFSTNPYWVYGRTDGGKGAYVFDASQSGTANINTNGSFDFTGTISSPSSTYNGKTVYAYPVDGAGLWGTGGSYQSSLYSQSRYGIDGLILKTYKDSSMSSGYANWAKVSSYSISMGTDISQPGIVIESDGDITAQGVIRLVQNWQSGAVGNNASLQFTGTNFWLNTAGNSYINPQGYVRLASSGGNGSVTYINDAYGIETSKGIKTGSLYTQGGTAVYTTDGSTIYFLNGKAGGRNDIAVKSVSQSSLVSQKTNICNVDTGYALNEVLKADVRSYSFIDDEDKQTHVSPMIDDVDNKMYIPKDWLDSEHEGVDTYSVIGYLIQAVKELNKKIEQLEQA